MRMLVLPREVQKNEVTPVACRRCRSLLSFSSRLRFSSVSPLLGATTSCFFPIVFTSTPHSCECDRPGRVEGKRWESRRRGVSMKEEAAQRRDVILYTQF